MARISTPESLEVGTIVGTRFSQLFLRVFEKFESEAELSTSYISHWNGNEFRMLRKFDREIVDIAFGPSGELLSLDSRGTLFSLAESNWSELAGPVDPPQRVSVLRVIGSRIFALGARASIFEYGEGSWREIDLGLGRVGVRDLVNFEGRDLFFCSTKGGFGRIDPEGNVEVIDLGTNVNLLSITLDDDELVVCGARSTLLRVSGSEVFQIPDEGGPRTLSRFASWDNKTLISATNAILTLDRNTLDEFAPIQSFRLVPTRDALFNQSLDAVQVLKDGSWSEFPVWLDIEDRPSATARPR